MDCRRWKPRACAEHGGVDPSDGITCNSADELRGLIETKDLVGGLTKGSGVVSYCGSMKSGLGSIGFRLASLEFLRAGSKRCEMRAQGDYTSAESADRHDLDAFQHPRSRHRAGPPARLTTCRTPRRLLISRNFARVAAK